MRLIDADKIEWCLNQGRMLVKKQTIDKMQTIDAVPVVHGRWIESPDNDGMDYECSNLKCKCRISYNGSRVSGDFNYCPNCGAKMDGKRRDDG